MTGTAGPSAVTLVRREYPRGGHADRPPGPTLGAAGRGRGGRRHVRDEAGRAGRARALPPGVGQRGGGRAGRPRRAARGWMYAGNDRDRPHDGPPGQHQQVTDPGRREDSSAAESTLTSPAATSPRPNCAARRRRWRPGTGRNRRLAWGMLTRISTSSPPSSGTMTSTHPMSAIRAARFSAPTLGSRAGPGSGCAAPARSAGTGPDPDQVGHDEIPVQPQRGQPAAAASSTWVSSPRPPAAAGSR